MKTDVNDSSVSGNPAMPSPPRLNARHKRSAMLGGLAGLAVLAAWFGYNYFATPAEPNVATATPAEIVAYVSNPRGLARLSDVEQQRFLDRWRQALAAQPARVDDLRKHFESLSTDARQAFTDQFFQTTKRNFLADARRFEQISESAEKSRFVRSKVAEYKENEKFVRSVAISFRRDFGTDEDSMKSYLMSNTTPEERMLGEPYVKALQQVREQIRKEQSQAKS